MSLFNQHKDNQKSFPTLLIKNGKHEGKTITLNSAKLTKWSSFFTIEFVKGYFILKAGKKHTVHVNGDPVVHKILTHGDIIQTDNVELRYAVSEDYSPMSAKLPDRNLPTGLLRGFLILLILVVAGGIMISKNPAFYEKIELALGLSKPAPAPKDPALAFLDQKSEKIDYANLTDANQIALARADWLSALRLLEESALHPQNIHKAQEVLQRAAATIGSISPQPDIAQRIEQLQKAASSSMKTKLQRLKLNALLLQRAGNNDGFKESLELIVAIEPDGKDQFHQWAELMRYQQ